MPKLNLSVDEVLSTTRAVRKRLDLNRPVEPEIIRECLELALQAPSPGGMQNWHFIVVADAEKRLALAEIYRKSTRAKGGQEDMLRQMIADATNEQEAIALTKIAETPFYLTENLHRVPVQVIPCIEGRAENLAGAAQSGYWGGIWPAMWSFMLAARSRGLGTVPTTLHLDFEREAAEILGIDYENVTQAGLIPVAYTIGTDFKPAGRKPLDSVLHWNGW
jgi:nitroreductase